MEGQRLKAYLSHIAESITSDTTLEDVYEQLSLLNDIDDAEEMERNGEVLSQDEVESKSRKWLK